MKYLLWLIFAAPAGWLLGRYLTDMISYGQFIHGSGQWSVGFLLAALAVTPLRRLAPRAAWPRFLMRQRRAMGVACFGYAALHTLVYLERKWGAGLILPEAREPDLLTGWIALFIFFLLAATSNNTSVRVLGRGWKTLHRLVYPGAALTFAHWLMTTFDPTWALVWLAVLILMETIRLLRRG